MEFQTARRTLRRDAVLFKTGLTRTSQYKLERAGDFPRHFMLTPRCAVWYEHEVDDWISKRYEKSIEAAPAPDVMMRRVNPVRRGRP
jgi:prophage regulatory protein